MKKHLLTTTIAVAFTGLAFAQDLPDAVRAQVHAIQADKAARSSSQRKLATSLRYLSREASGLLAVEGVPDLTSRVELEKDGRVTVDITAAPGAALRKAIENVGGTVIYESARWNSVRAYLPPVQLSAIAGRADVKRIAKGAKATSHAARVINEADPAHKAPTTRAGFGVNGAGIKVGVISDSADHYLDSLAKGELPASFTILPGRSGIGDGNTGEGTAMSEIVHDIAPGAQLFFAAAAPGKAGFAESITLLRAAGCQIIVDDISYSSDEWQFQDDEIGQAVNEVVEDGALYLSSSGNEGNLKNGTSSTWEGDFADGGAATAPLPAGSVHSFGTQTFNRLKDGKSPVVLQWSDEYRSSSNDYDLYILNAAGTRVVASSTDTQDGTQAPIEVVDNVRAGERIVIFKSAAAQPRYLRVIGYASKLEIATAGQTIGHAATANSLCVASSDASLAAPGPFTTASLNEKSSSDGPHKMFYRPDGTPITPGNFLASGGITLQTPALTAGDGGKTSVVGFEQFYGTSAAAPAAAGIAALVWSRNPSLTNLQVRAILESSCLDIEAAGFEVNSGNGILMADLAVANAVAGSEIAVERPALTNIVSESTQSFGSVPVGASADLVFTIRNLGNAALTGLGITFSGTNAADFQVFASPTAPVSALTGSTSFTVRFSSAIAGAKSATLSIPNNDTDEAPFTIKLTAFVRDAASIGLDDAVTVTGGTTRVYPLANDLSAGGVLSIVSVSDPRIVIDGRALIIPDGFTGVVGYTVSDGTTTGNASVNVIGREVLDPASKWEGLLYDGAGNIAGSMAASRSARGAFTGNLRVGTAGKGVAFRLTDGTATVSNALGTLTITEETNGQLSVSLAATNAVTGVLRLGNPDAAKSQYNVALAAIDAAIPGGSFATASVKTNGAVSIVGRLPDGRKFTAKSLLADNGDFPLYAVVAKTNPKAIIAGELVQSDLLKTDVTGELQWTMAAQRAGIHSAGVDTALTANGCIYMPGELPADGPGTLTLSGGDIAGSSAATTITIGKPTLTPLVPFWKANARAGAFTFKVKDPTQRAASGNGIYLPKSDTAWGFFPGSTVGGRVVLEFERF